MYCHECYQKEHGLTRNHLAVFVQVSLEMFLSCFNFLCSLCISCGMGVTKAGALGTDPLSKSAIKIVVKNPFDIILTCSLFTIFYLHRNFMPGHCLLHCALLTCLCNC